MFNQRKNKRFSYKPRYQDSNGDENREMSKSSMEAKWNELRGNSKRRGNFLTSLPGLIFILAAIFALIYVLNGYIK